MKLLYIPAPQLVGGLEMTFDESANFPVSNPTDIAGWNAFFDTINNGTAFTRIQIAGSTVKLYGGSGIMVKPYLFNDSPSNIHLISVNDKAGCLIALGDCAFWGCSILNTFIAHYATSIGQNAFGANPIATNYELPLMQSAGIMAFTNNFLVTDFHFESLQTVSQSMFQDCHAAEIFYFPNARDIGTFAFIRCTSATQFYLPSLQRIIGNYVWYGITGRSILLTVPHAMMVINGGYPHSEIQSLMSQNTVTVVQV